MSKSVSVVMQELELTALKLRKFGVNWVNKVFKLQTYPYIWHDGDWRSPEYMLNEKRYKVLKDILDESES